MIAFFDLPQHRIAIRMARLGIGGAMVADPEAFTFDVPVGPRRQTGREACGPTVISVMRITDGAGVQGAI